MSGSDHGFRSLSGLAMSGLCERRVDGVCIFSILRRPIYTQYISRCDVVDGYIYGGL